MLFGLVLVSCVTLIVGQTPCDNLKATYRVFGCKPFCPNRVTYSCDVAPIRINYQQTTCYYQGDGKQYQPGDKIPTKVVSQAGTSCIYTCDTSDATVGPRWVASECSGEPTDATQLCSSQIVDYMGPFYKKYAPVFSSVVTSDCPRKWINDNFSNVPLDDCSANRYECCEVPTTTGYVKIGSKFAATTYIECECKCPPFLTCTEYPKPIAQ
ncbi:hypothetical protein PPYR_13513 [Photinus pyralis]|uniref:DUF4789 domain-containing protein n=1 Tax=Photinus pyralis TaxID=7054 RepID=A0A5N4A998_PHOPY|nr:uncharacterized protein LOC116179653 [Photinus pyralis]KAB0793893.1 hypothetical protein PPYR_13513 [Photinus pyralis]